MLGSAGRLGVGMVPIDLGLSETGGFWESGSSSAKTRTGLDNWAL